MWPTKSETLCMSCVYHAKAKGWIFLLSFLSYDDHKCFRDRMLSESGSWNEDDVEEQWRWHEMERNRPSMDTKHEWDINIIIMGFLLRVFQPSVNTCTTQSINSGGHSASGFIVMWDNIFSYRLKHLDHVFFCVRICNRSNCAPRKLLSFLQTLIVLSSLGFSWYHRTALSF